MSIELKAVLAEKRVILEQLMQLCLHDYSEFDPFEIGPEGRFRYRWLDAYFVESERHPFFIYWQDRLAGFVLLRESNENQDWDFQIAEFFVLRRYRREAIGKAAATKALSLFAGWWEICFDNHNLPAVAFWESVVSQYGKFEKEPITGEPHRSRYLLKIG